ncbi:CAAX amino terminal protease [Clostridium putrefaciens]|uniref:CAAX amino terminal protease n=1 Tax=Clostridium putrefaciens TaxID=99675 RepID=A0A381J8L2_9CLOT|nr:CPBP family intramembrane glutamic endopeptidase [Clostridium putrefaciens]SUY47551.1 CAAX amino terminal protease [Clostridium putrefaciens]
MSTHILCLNILILLVTLSPVMCAQTIMYIINKGVIDYSMDKFLKMLAVVLSIVIFLSAIFKIDLLIVELPKQSYWYLLGLVSVLVILIIEVLISYIIICLSGKSVSGITLITTWKRSTIKVIGLSVIVALLEEMIFRQIWFSILIKEFKINAMIVIIITGFVYAMNHIFLGKKVLIQKFVSGIIYGCLFYFSGNCVIIPVIAHCVQNGVILMKDRG